MNNKFRKLIKTTLLGTASSIISANASNFKESDLLVESSDDFDEEFFANEDIHNPLKYMLKPKLLLFQNSLGDWEYSSHRSHRSHSSHRSHYSSYSTPTPTPAPTNNLTNSYSSGSSNSTKKSTLKYNRVKFKNNCSETVQLLVRFLDYSTGEWVTKAWYEIAPYETAYILNTKNATLYYYATSDSYTWKGDEGNISHNGKNYELKKIKISTTTYGDYVYKLNCDL